VLLTTSRPHRRGTRRERRVRTVGSPPAKRSWCESRGGGMETANQFDLQEVTDAFRNEHRGGRDTFLAIGQALRARDTARIGELMGQANTLIGPHMQYEEEVMYPELAVLFGEE